jgi:hypothetical protein
MTWNKKIRIISVSIFDSMIRIIKSPTRISFWTLFYPVRFMSKMRFLQGVPMGGGVGVGGDTPIFSENSQNFSKNFLHSRQFFGLRDTPDRNVSISRTLRKIISHTSDMTQEGHYTRNISLECCAYRHNRFFLLRINHYFTFPFISSE